MSVSPAIAAAITTTISPLEAHRQWVRQTGITPRPSPPALNSSAFIGGSTPLQDFAAEVQRDLVYDFKPLVSAPEPVSAVHTPAYSHASRTMLSEPGLRLSAELGPLIWIHADRGAPGDVGLLLDAWA